MHDEDSSTADRHLFPSPNPRLLMYREDGRPLHEAGGRAAEDEGCDGGGRGSGDIGELGAAEGLSDSTLDGGEDSGKSTDWKCYQKRQSSEISHVFLKVYR